MCQRAVLILSFAGIAQLAGVLPLAGVVPARRLADPEVQTSRSVIRLSQTTFRTPDAILKSVVDNDLEAVVRDILAVAGREGQPFTMTPSTRLPTAGAASAGRMMLVVYNPNFLHRVSERAGTNWPVVLTLAHEVAHYLVGHTEPGGASYPTQELEANELAGFVVAVLGASLEDTRRSARAMCEVAPPDRPLTAEGVLVATEQGWLRSARSRGLPLARAPGCRIAQPGRRAHNRAEPAKEAGPTSMCYMVYISTDCADDLSLQTSNEVRFEKPSVEAQSPRPRVLRHEYAWFVGSESGCSCTFRHLCRESVDLGFGAPEDWFPEEEDRVDATKRLYQILKQIVERGYRLEVLDCWSGDEGKEPNRRDVSLSQVPADHFRFFEGYLFTLTP